MNAPRFPEASIATATKVSGVIVERTDRNADIATIADHHRVNPVRDDLLLSRVFRRLGWEMLIDEALAMLATAYEDETRFTDRINAENRALAAGRRA